MLEKICQGKQFGGWRNSIYIEKCIVKYMLEGICQGKQLEGCRNSGEREMYSVIDVQCYICVEGDL